jgi:hypothetical protein
MDIERLLYQFEADYEIPEFQPYLLAVGKLSARWSLFEYTLNDIIWELGNLSPKTGTCLTAQLIGPRPRFRCLAALLTLREANKRLIKCANSMSVEAESLSQQRNRYVHDPVVFRSSDKSFHIMETTADRKVKHGVFLVDIADITKLTNEIADLQRELEFLHARIVTETPPWPRTEYAQSEGIRRARQATDSAPSGP